MIGPATNSPSLRMRWLVQGACLAALILTLSCQGGGAGKRAEQDPTPAAQSTDAAAASPACSGTGKAGGTGSEVQMRFLALGDSYTIGESVAPAERWPEQLVARLREQGFDLAPPQIIARTGWTTSELAAAMDRAQPNGPYEIVSLLIGVNNQYRSRPVAEYRQQFAELLQRAIVLAGRKAGRVLVLSIPDWSVTPFAAGRDRAVIASEIDEYNGSAAVESERFGARFVNVTPESRQAAAEPALIARDGLHPSGLMYADWARLALPTACQALAIAD